MRWAAMLRGINLGKRQLKSAELKAVVEGLGHSDVQTLLASGNVVFSAQTGDAAALEAQLYTALAAQTGLKSDVFVRSPDEMARIVAANPFPDEVRERPSFVVVTFHREEFPRDRLDWLAANYHGPERLVAHGRELYADYPDGQGRSNLPAAMVKGKFPGQYTARNWNTVLKIRAALG